MIFAKDKQARFRFLGVVVWFALLIYFVPSWYANPVSFSPEDAILDNNSNSGQQVLFKEAYRLPPRENAQAELNQAIEGARAVAESDRRLMSIPESVENTSVVPQVLSKAETQTQDNRVSQQGWMVILASYREQESAQRFVAQLQQLEYSAKIKHYVEDQQYSVRVVGIESREKAKTEQRKLDKLFKLKDSYIRRSR